MFERIRNDSKARTLAAVQAEAERYQTESCHMWTATSTAEKERFFAKSGYTMIILSLKDHGLSPAIHHH